MCRQSFHGELHVECWVYKIMPSGYGPTKVVLHGTQLKQRHIMLTPDLEQLWFNAGPTSQTLAQHWIRAAPASSYTRVLALHLCSTRAEAMRIRARGPRSCPNVHLLLGQRLSLWPNIKPELSQRPEFAGSMNQRSETKTSLYNASRLIHADPDK